MNREKDMADAFLTAARYDQVDRMWELIQDGVDVNAREHGGLTALHYAALRNNPDTLSLLLGAGADIDARSERSGSTPLHYAAEYGLLEAVQYLIRTGCDMTARNKDGKTPEQCIGMGLGCLLKEDAHRAIAAVFEQERRKRYLDRQSRLDRLSRPRPSFPGNKT